MFREISRIKQKLSADECIFILENEKRGVLAVNGDDGYPYALPMNHFYKLLSLHYFVAYLKGLLSNLLYLLLLLKRKGL